MEKILVVDDEVKACELLKRFLEIKGYDVATSYSGKDALEKVEKEKPDVILLDLKMPGMDGMDLLRCIREYDKDIAVIIVTAVKDEELAKKFLKKGAVKYITKPVDLIYLERSVLAGLAMRNK